MSDEGKDTQKSGTPGLQIPAERRKALTKLANGKDAEAAAAAKGELELAAMTFEEQVEASAQQAFQQIQAAKRGQAERQRLVTAANARLQELLAEAGEATAPSEADQFSNGVASKLGELEQTDYQARVERAARDAFAAKHHREPAADWRTAPIRDAGES